MNPVINLRHLAHKNLTIKGEMDIEALELTDLDELVRLRSPVTYDLEVQKFTDHLLAKGHVEVQLDCECALCLKPFQKPLVLPEWLCHLELQGPEAVVIDNDCVDLTPHIREDILLELPRNPHCSADCKGLPVRGAEESQGFAQTGDVPSAWAELDKLKF